MYILPAETLTHDQQEKIFSIWNAVYPETICYQDLAAFQDFLNRYPERKHFLLFQQSGDALCGWAMSFWRDKERWFSILIDPSVQGKGWGSFLLNAVKQNEIALNGWVVDRGEWKKRDGTNYHSPLAFYLKNDFHVIPDVRFDSEKLSTVKIHWESLEK